MIWSFKLGFIEEMKYASNFLHTSLLLGALQMAFQVKLLSKLSLKCFDGFDLTLGVHICTHRRYSTKRPQVVSRFYT